MSTLTRWSPLRELDDMHQRLSRFFTSGSGSVDPVTRDEVTVAGWLPLVDISEDDQGYVIKAELPEIDKKDVSVRVENGVLTLSGERRFESEEKSRKYHRVERAYGSFTRRFSLPDDADTQQVHAEYKDGVLTVRVAKDAGARPRSIEVKVG